MLHVIILKVHIDVYVTLATSEMDTIVQVINRLVSDSFNFVSMIYNIFIIQSFI